MSLFKTIVVAVDFSEASRGILQFAARLSKLSPGSHLLLAHVVPDPLREPFMVEAVGVNFVDLQREWMVDATRRLNGLLATEGLTNDATPVVLAGHPAEEIVALAKHRGADAIVIGTHGYGGVKHLVLGSVAEKVLRGAICPVITVPEKSLAAHRVPAA